MANNWGCNKSPARQAKGAAIEPPALWRLVLRPCSLVLGYLVLNPSSWARIAQQNVNCLNVRLGQSHLAELDFHLKIPCPVWKWGKLSAAHGWPIALIALPVTLTNFGKSTCDGNKFLLKISKFNGLRDVGNLALICGLIFHIPVAFITYWPQCICAFTLEDKKDISFLLFKILKNCMVAY